MLTVGVRELKNRLTHYLQLTHDGERIIVTDHGNPIAVLHDLTKLESEAPPEEYLAKAAAGGIVRLPQPGAKLDLKTKPAAHKGRSASETLIEDRR